MWTEFECQIVIAVHDARQREHKLSLEVEERRRAQDTINKKVLPLKDNLIKQEARLAHSNADLATAQSTLDEKERGLAKVKVLYDDAMAKKQTLLDDAETCRFETTAAAAELIEGLAGEKDRWTQQSLEFKSQIEQLVVDVLSATPFLSYCGLSNQEFRNLLQSKRHHRSTKLRQETDQKSRRTRQAPKPPPTPSFDPICLLNQNCRRNTNLHTTEVA